jgi:Uma2 family endonuclease
MSVATIQSEAVQDRVFDLDDQDRYEIIDGLKVELPPMSVQASVLASRIATQLSVHGMTQNIGEAVTETLFTLPSPLDRNRRPDFAFVPYSRWPAGLTIPHDNAWDVLPSLVGEVVSPTDWAEDLLQKVEEYFRSGVTVVWVVYPQRQLVYVYTSPTAVRVLTRADVLTTDIVPGFTLPLTSVFPTPEQSS